MPVIALQQTAAPLLLVTEDEVDTHQQPQPPSPSPHDEQTTPAAAAALLRSIPASPSRSDSEEAPDAPEPRITRSRTTLTASPQPIRKGRAQRRPSPQQPAGMRLEGSCDPAEAPSTPEPRLTRSRGTLSPTPPLPATKRQRTARQAHAPSQPCQARPATPSLPLPSRQLLPQLHQRESRPLAQLEASCQLPSKQGNESVPVRMRASTMQQRQLRDQSGQPRQRIRQVSGNLGPRK